MKKIITGAILASAIAATPAFAQDADKGLYVQLRTGVADLNNPDFTISDPSSTDRIDTRLNTKSAWAFGGELGYDFGGVRVGLDLAYQRNKVKSIGVKSINGTAVTAANIDNFFDCEGECFDDLELDGVAIDGTNLYVPNGNIAKVRQIAVMANVTYDIPVGDTFKPYVGAGLGAVGTHVNAFDEDDGSIRFAWQLRAGAAFQVTQGVALTADYTYRQTSAGKLSFADSDYNYRLGKTKASLFAVGLRFTL